MASLADTDTSATADTSDIATTEDNGTDRDASDVLGGPAADDCSPVSFSSALPSVSSTAAVDVNGTVASTADTGTEASCDADSDDGTDAACDTSDDAGMEVATDEAKLTTVSHVAVVSLMSLAVACSALTAGGGVGCGGGG